MELLTAGQMRAADHAAIAGMKIPSLTLMENAGTACARIADILARKHSKGRPAKIAVLCGKGNNGGDGFVTARLLARMRHRVTVFLAADDGSLSRDAEIEFRHLPKKVRVLRVHTAALWKKEKRNIDSADLLIDALFGTGLSKNLTGVIKEMVESVNGLSIPVLAVDIPSGIDATTGRVLGAAIRAHTTVTFARPKIGHVLHPGAAFTGRLAVADIGIPDDAVQAARPDTFLMDRRIAADILPARPPQSHKGTFGRSVILAGSRGMVGAAVLAAEAALRIGSGLTLLCVPDAVYTIAARKVPPEIMCRPVSDKGRGVFGPEAIREILPFLSKATCVLIGPGIGRDPATLRWVGLVLKSLAGKKKVVLDADALYAIALNPRALQGDVAVTPHAGEMAKLGGISRAAVEADPCSVARGHSKKHSLTAVLKGSRTVIANSKGEVYVNRTGNAALAKGATGDVLAGLICGLAAQGLSTFDAARLGVWIHGRAADIAVGRGRDPRTFLASDLFTYLDPALLELSGKNAERSGSKPGVVFL